MLLNSAPSISRSARTLIDSVPALFAASVLQELMLVPETAPLALALARTQKERLASNPTLTDSAGLGFTVRYSNAWGGILDSGTVAGLRPVDRAQLAVIGVFPTASALSEAQQLIGRQPATLSPTLPLLASARDTLSIGRIAVALDSVDRANATAERSTKLGDYARAMGVLARGDSAGALRALLRLSMTSCDGAPCAGFTLAQLLARAGRDADAAKVLDRWLPTGSRALVGPGAMLLRAQTAERMGDQSGAHRWYQQVAARWGSGSQSVQTMLTLAKDGVKRTAGRV